GGALRPFHGETPMEVLIKHLTDTPDLSHLPAAYRGVIGKALEKDPARRYTSVGELAKAVEEMFGGRREAGALPPPLPPSPAAPPRAVPRAVPVGGSLIAAVPIARP